MQLLLVSLVLEENVCSVVRWDAIELSHYLPASLYNLQICLPVLALIETGLLSHRKTIQLPASL